MAFVALRQGAASHTSIVFLLSQLDHKILNRAEFVPNYFREVPLLAKALVKQVNSLSWA